MAAGLESISANELLDNLGLKDRLVIACVNSPENVTFSGDEDAIDILYAHCQNQDIFVRILKTDGRAYHSHHMLGVSQEYEDMLSDNVFHAKSCQPKSALIPLLSSVTSELIEPSQTRTAVYWRQNLESPVHFSAALETMFSTHEYHIIEVGPHPALKLTIFQTQKALGIEKSHRLYSSTLSRGLNSVTTMLRLAGTLFLHKYEVDIDRINTSTGIVTAPARRRVLSALPNRRWDHGPLLWHESRVSRESRNRKYPRHELLGTRVPGDNGKTMTWRNVINVQDIPWLGDHRLGQTVVFPAAGYLAIAVEAFQQAVEADKQGTSTLAFRQVNFLNALAFLDENSGVELLTELRPLSISGTTISKVWWQFEISSYIGQTPTLHANGYIGIDASSQAIPPSLNFPTASMEWQSMRTWYGKMPTCNINPGPAFHSLTEIMVDRMRVARQTMAKTILKSEDLSGTDGHSRYCFHPTTIDALLQTAWIASTAGSIEDLKGQVPVSIGSVKMKTSSHPYSPEPCIIRGTSEPVGFQSAKFSSEMYDPEGVVQLQMQEMRAVPYQEIAALEETPEKRYPMLRILWKPDVSLLIPEDSSNVVDCGDGPTRPVQTRLPEADKWSIAGVLDLLAHKSPNMNILLLGDYDEEINSDFLTILNADSALRRFQSFTWASSTLSGACIREDSDDDKDCYSVGRAAFQRGQRFDIIVITTVKPSS